MTFNQVFQQINMVLPLYLTPFALIIGIENLKEKINQFNGNDVFFNENVFVWVKHVLHSYFAHRYSFIPLHPNRRISIEYSF